MSSTINHAPPQWPVYRYDVELDRETAAKFQQIWQKRCDKAGQDHKDRPDLTYNAMFNQAIKDFVDTHLQELNPE